MNGIMRRLIAPLVSVLFIAACATPTVVLQVTDLFPEPDAENVPVDSVISATFNVGIDSASVDGNFTLAPSAGGSAVAGTVAYDADTRTATFTPSAALAFGTEYTATVAGEVTTVGGTSLGGDASWSFTTAADPGPEPGVSSVSIDQDDQVLVVGSDVALSVTVEAVGGASSAVTWASSDTSVATVDAATGVVVAVAEGSASITATSTFDATRSDSITVTVWEELTASAYADGALLVDTELTALTTTVAGGTGTYEFEITEGALPAGVSLDESTGTISGTPTEVGVGEDAFTGTVTVTDGVQSVDLPFSVQVAAVMSASDTLVATADAGTNLELTIVVSGGLAPFDFEVTPDPLDPLPNGPLAPGLTLDGDGVISGTLTTANFYRTFITTTDALGQTAETMVEVDVLLVLNYTGTPYAYPVGCGGDVFGGSVECPASDEPLGTLGAEWSAITPSSSIEVIGASGDLTFSMTLQTDGLSDDRWTMAAETGVVFRRNDDADNDAVTHNGTRTYLVTVEDDGSARTAEATVVFEPVD